MNEMTIDATTVAWTDAGEGEPTLLIHAAVFGAWFEPLAERLPGRVIRMLRAGYTGGPQPTELIELSTHAAHAAALLDALGTGPATIVAHSSGCAIALQLATDRPDLVRRLVLSEPPLVDGLLDPVDGPQVQAFLGSAIGAAMGAFAAGDVPRAYDAFMDAVCGPDHRAVFVDVLGAGSVARAEQDSVFTFSNEIPAINLWKVGDLSAVTVPTLLVAGGASIGATHRLVDHLAALLPEATAATIDGANHLLPLTHPDALAELVVRSGRVAAVQAG